MRTTGPTPRELAETRAYLIGSIPRLLETNQSIAAFLQTSEQYGLGLDYDRRLARLAPRRHARGGARARPRKRSTRHARRSRSPVRASPDVREVAQRLRTRAVFFDVDFTLIHPGPAFQGAGYRELLRAARDRCRPGALRSGRVAAASVLLDARGGIYDPQVFIDYTRRIIEGMGGAGPQLDAAARDIYDEWAACQHFSLYEDVPEVLRTLHAAGLKIGLISNTQRCLASFQTHFALEGLFSVAISSSAHGYMKPHPSHLRVGASAGRRRRARGGDGR